MSSVMPCPSCQTRLAIPDETTARKVRCPKCKGVVEMRGAATANVAARTPAPPPVRSTPPVRPAATSNPVRAPQPPRALPTAELMDDDTERAVDTPTEAPRRKKRRRRRYYDDEPVKKKRPAWFWGLAGAGAFMGLVFVGIFFLILSRMNLLPDMPTLLFGLIIMVPISCVILVISMFASSAIAGGIDFGAFHVAVLKGFLLLVVVNFVAAIPFIGWALTFPIWIFGLMILYELDLWETRFLVFMNWALNTICRYAVIYLIITALSQGGGDDLPPGAAGLGAGMGGIGSPTANRLEEMERKRQEELEKQLALEARIIDKWEELGAKLFSHPNRELEGIALIDLTDSRITDNDLADLKVFKSLNTLELGNAQITDKGVAHLKEVTWLRTLGAGKARITENAIKDLQKVNPGLIVMR